MENWKANLYRLSLRALPKPAWSAAPVIVGDMPLKNDFVRILKRQHAIGAVVALFDENGMTDAVACGQISKGGESTRVDTVYRIASVTKHMTAMAALRLSQDGKIDLDADVDPFLPCSLRHPKDKTRPVTLRRLITHTAGIHDGAAYNSALMNGKTLSEIMRGDSFADAVDAFEYSNLGAGIVACVLEGMLGVGFEEIMQQALFMPLRVTATFYPQKVQGSLADAWRILPPAKAANYNAKARREKPLPAMGPDSQGHYALAQGNLCISAPELCKLGSELMKERYAPMREYVVSFGARAYNLSEGLGTFIVEDKSICPQKIYGHQGLAYGAVHGLFYDPEIKRGVVVLTSGCSEARNGVLADINKDVMKKVFR